MKESYDEFRKSLITLAETNVYYSTSQIPELKNIETLIKSINNDATYSTFIKMLMDISKISQTVDRLVDQKTHKVKDFKFISQGKNISKISTEEISKSLIYKNLENREIKKLTSSSIQVIENMSNFPYTVDETVFEGGVSNSIRINIENYEHTKIPTMRFLNKYSYFKTQHKIVILIKNI